MSVLINDYRQARAWSLIRDQIELSSRFHPRFPKDPLRRVAIMCEESGEALRAAIDLTRDFVLNTTGMTAEEVDRRVESDRSALRKELIVELTHTAAMAIKCLIAFDEDQFPDPDYIPVNPQPQRERILD